MIAGMSIGLSKWRAIWHIMVPQVFNFSTAGLGSEYALLIKDSAYVYVIGLAEVMTNAVTISHKSHLMTASRHSYYQLHSLHCNNISH